MNDFKVAKRYAQALALLAENLEDMQEIGRELDFACDTIYGNDELRTIYTGVQFANTDKKNVIRNIFTDSLSENMLHFLLLLVDKMRPAYLADIRTAYHALLDEANGVADATVYSAFALSDDEVKALTEALSKATDKSIRLHTEVDPGLLAGLRIRYGDYVIDGSAKARLEQLREKLTHEDKPTEVRD